MANNKTKKKIDNKKFRKNANFDAETRYDNRSDSTSYRSRDTKPNSRDSKCIDQPRVHNDLNWYVHSAQEAVQLGSLPFNTAVGVPVSLNGQDYNISGLMRLNTAPIYGQGSTPLSAINVAARAVYALNRKANSGASNYTATAYSFYLFAFDSIYYLINHVKRAFATFNTYNTYNRYLPKVMLEAMGFTYEDMANNFPGHVARLNQIIRRVAVFNVPKVFPIFDRHAFLFSTVMRDTKGKQTQLYFHNPTHYYEYIDVVAEGEGSALKAHRIGWGYDQGPVSPDQWLELLENLIDKCYASAIFQIMNGDTEKCFGDNVYKLSLFTGNEELTIVDDDMVKTQVMNATMVGYLDNLDVTESLDPDINGDFYLVHEPTFARYPNTNNGPDEYVDHIINMYMEPTPANVIEASRNMIPYHTAPASGDRVNVGNKSDVIQTATVYVINGTDIVWEREYSFLQPFEEGSPISTWPKWWELIRQITTFDYAPAWVPVWIGQGATTLESGQLGCTPLIRNENWTVMPESQINIIDEVAIQKLFGF